jgi:molecular chaperone GrpE
MPSSRANEHEAAVRAGAPDDERPAAELRAELADVREQLAASENRYMRARADLENYRKRADRESERRLLERQDELLRSWLDAVDSIERAIALEAQHPEATSGLRAVLEQMDAILRRYRVQRIGDVGDRFDPELHEAVAVAPSRQHDPGTIAEVARSGYAVDGRVLRPAQVAVARPAERDG